MAYSVCMLLLSTLTTIFFTAAFQHYYFTTSFFSTHSIEVLDDLNMPINVANLAAFCCVMLKPITHTFYNMLQLVTKLPYYPTLTC